MVCSANPRVGLSTTEGEVKEDRANVCLQNNLRLEGTFLNVDQLVNGAWTAVRSDSHPSTTYQWTRTSTVRISPLSPLSSSMFVCLAVRAR